MTIPPLNFFDPLFCQYTCYVFIACLRLHDVTLAMVVGKKSFPLLGTKLYFHPNSAEKYILFYFYVVANLEIASD